MDNEARHLTSGMRGMDVRALHGKLEALAFQVDPNEREEGLFGPSTLQAVERFQIEREVSVVTKGGVDAQTNSAINAEIENSAWSVKGTVNRGETPVLARVQATDRTLRASTLLGEAWTDSNGRFCIYYRSSAFLDGQSGRAAPNLCVEVFAPQGNGQLGRSEVIFQARMHESLDIEIALAAGTAEFDIATATIGPSLAGLSPAALAEDELMFLAQSSGLPAESVRAFINSSQLEALLPSIPPKLLYALCRVHALGDFKPSLSLSADRLKVDVDTAVERGHVSRFVETVDDAIRSLVETSVQERANKFTNRISEIGLATEDRLSMSLAGLGSKPDVTAHDMWTELTATADLPPQSLDNLRFLSQLLLLTGNRLSLIREILKAVPQGTSNVRDFVSFHTEAWWREVISATIATDGGILQPNEDVSIEDRIANYAKFLVRAIDGAFPTLAFARDIAVQPALDASLLSANTATTNSATPTPSMLVDWASVSDEPRFRRAIATTNELRREWRLFPSAPEHSSLDQGAFKNNVRAAVADFLTKARDFDITVNPIREYSAQAGSHHFAGVANPMQSAVVDQIATIQRLLPFAPTNRQVEALLANGLRSAGEIAGMSEQLFVETFASEFEGESTARAAHIAARRVAAASAQLLRTLHSAANDVIPNALALTTAGVLRALPEYQALFGSFDLCACSHCRSLYSPAAYFVELLEFLGAAAPSTDSSPLAALLRRRPDLEHIPLSCANTNTVLPYIDLVNEVLESYAALGHLDKTAAHDTGSGTSPDLAVRPAYTIDAAYDRLEAAISPISLPFSSNLVETRAWLENLGTSRGELMRTFAPRSSSPSELHAEALAFSALDYRILTGALAPPRPLREFFGYDSDTVTVDSIWFESQLPSGSALEASSDPWVWVGKPFARIPGSPVLATTPGAGTHRQAFNGAAPALKVPPGGTLFAEVYFIPQQRPREILLEWNDGNPEHRAFWGEDAIAAGVLGTPSRFRVNPLIPAADTWNRLEVAASQVGLGPSITGVGFSVVDGSAFFARVGAATIVSWQEHLSAVSQFLSRTRLSYAALLALLHAKYINPNLSMPQVTLEASPDHPCDLSHIRIRGLNDAVLERVHRFVRLSGRTGIGISDLDIAATTFGGVIDPALLERLAAATEVKKRVDLLWDALLSLWGNMDTLGRPAVEEAGILPGYYQRLFLNRAIINPPDNDFNLNAAGELIGSQSPLLAKKPAIMAALRLSQMEFDAVCKSSSLDQTALLTLSNLSRLQRHALFARAVGISIEDLIELKRLSSIDPFAGPADALRFMDALKTIQLTTFSVATLSYMLRHNSLIELAPTVAYVDAFIEQLKNQLTKLEGSERAPGEGTPGSQALIYRAMSSALQIDAAMAEFLLSKVFKAKTAPNQPATYDFQLVRLLAAQAGQDAIRQQLQSSFVALSKAARFIGGFSITLPELIYFTDNSADFGSCTVADFPIAESPVAPPLWVNWTLIADYCAARSTMDKPGSPQVLSVMRSAKAGATLAALLRDVARFFRRDESDLVALCGPAGYDLEPKAFLNTIVLGTISRALRLATIVGAPIAQLFEWATHSPDTTATTALRAFVKAKYDEKMWVAIATPVANQLREQRRSALIDYILTMPSIKAAAISTSDQLCELFLIDVNMSSCMKTSRIKQALASIQLFVQRCLLNLEPLVKPAAIDPETWKWLKHYRTWEANRKVFLYPENVIEPELRDNKSEFFRDFETELLQSDISGDTAEAAYRSYLDRVHEVARLEICGMFREEQTIHVFGRTFGQSKKHFYRVWNGFEWSGWQRIPLDIQGDLPAPVLTPFAYKGRVFLFWPIFAEKSPGPEKDQLDGQPGEKNKAKRYWDVSLAFSEYRNGKWSPKRVSADSIPSFDETSTTATLPRKERHSLRPHFNPYTKELVVWLLLQGKVTYEGRTYEAKPQDSLATAVTLGIWRQFDCSGDLIRESGLVPSAWQSPKYYTLISPTAVPNLGNFHGKSYRVEGSTALSVRQHLEGSDDFAEILKRSPTSSFQVLPTDSMRNADDPGTSFTWLEALKPFTFQDERGVYWVTSWSSIPRRSPWFFPGETPLLADTTNISWRRVLRSVIDVEPPASTLPHLAADGQNDALALRDVPADPPKLRFSTFWHAHVCTFMSSLAAEGIPGLLTLENQTLANDKPSVRFEALYQPTSLVGGPYPIEKIDFSPQSAYGIYNMELFLHGPMLIAGRLSQDRQYAEAQQWYHYLFNPTIDTDEIKDPTPQRYWRSLPLRNDQTEGRIEILVRALTDPKADPAIKEAAKAQLESWWRNPFQPHRIAELRLGAYQRTVFMKYLDNLIAWGDHLFAQNTIESTNEATQLYLLASSLLGPKPEQVAKTEKPAQTFAELRSTQDQIRLLTNELEGSVAASGVAELTAELLSGRVPLAALKLSWVGYFCIPQNEKLLNYWNVVGDRLYKIRHCQNLEGVARPLALFEPPIDPALLVRATALGVDIETVIEDSRAGAGHYRFGRAIDRAERLCSELRTIGGLLLAVLEKKDAEGLEALRASHRSNLLRVVRSTREQEVKEAQSNLESIQKTREITEARFTFYKNIVPISPREDLHLRLLDEAQFFQSASQMIDVQASAASLLPTWNLGSSGAYSTPVVTTSFGGTNIAAALNAASRAALMLSSLATYQANRAATLAGWDRRAAEWGLQAELASRELQQIDRQIVAAQVRLAIAEGELVRHDREAEDASATESYLRDKFTNSDLYGWLSARMSACYFQFYRLTYNAAKEAERAYIFELCLKSSQIVQPGYWNSLKNGLASGEELQLDLGRLQQEFLRQNKRDLEITKSISLVILDPHALINLKATGQCEFEVPEALFDLDYPGHYLRRLKSLCISVPCVSGPHAGVHATLTLVSSRIRTDPSAASAYPEKPNDERFSYEVVATQSIATSTGRDDFGLFEPILQDERYLPFEGAGAISRWRLEMSRAANTFDIDTVSDVLLKFLYTARYGGDELKAKAAAAAQLPRSEFQSSASGATAIEQPNLCRYFSVRQEFGDAWHAFSHPPANQPGHTLTLNISQERFPLAFRSRRIQISKAEVFLSFDDSVHLSSDAQLTPQYPGNGVPVEMTVATADVTSQIKLESKMAVLAGLPLASKALDVPVAPGLWTFSVNQTNVDALDSSLTIQTEINGVSRRQINPRLLQDCLLVLRYAVDR